MKRALVQGTTPTDTFIFDDALNNVEKVVIVYRQKLGGTRLEKVFTEFEEDQYKVDVYISQAESLKFEPGECYISVIVKFKDGSRFEPDEPFVKIIKKTAKREVV